LVYLKQLLYTACTIPSDGGSVGIKHVAHNCTSKLQTVMFVRG
jgi:hypothetical protein